MINSTETLIVFLAVFGIWGVVRGKEREIWTVCTIALMMLFLAVGDGTDFIRKLPIHFASSIMSLVGDQTGSTNLAKQSLPDGVALTILWIAVIGLVALAYFIGYRGGNQSPEFSKRSVGSHVAGFFMGAVNGIFICAFLFSQGGFHLNFSIQFPDGDLTRNIIGPLILGGFVLTLIALAISSRKTA